MDVYVDSAASPAGPVTFAVDEEGKLRGLQFVDGQYDCSLEQELERAGFRVAHDPERTIRVREQVLEYGAGGRRAFDVDLALAGSEWQRTVWQALINIPFGQTRTYAQIATMIGHPGAARAVGRANATNRIPLIVPCHRVIGANGSLTGFAGGTHIKERLLAHEQRVCADTALQESRHVHDAAGG